MPIQGIYEILKEVPVAGWWNNSRCASGLVWRSSIFIRRARILLKEFSGEQALKDVEYQIGLGPRVPESPAHDQIVNWIQSQLKEAGWSVEVQETQRMGHPIQNVIGKWGEGTPWIILGAHYDSRLAADQDPNQSNHSLPVPGANDGASGVAVLLELARNLPSHLKNIGKYRADMACLF